MDLKRRNFLKLAGFFSIAAFTDFSGLLADISTRPEIRRYPGKIKRFDETEIRSMGKWLG